MHHACICYSHHRNCPICDLVKVKTPSRPGMRSESDVRLFKPPVTLPNRVSHGERAFEHSAALIWNPLPLSILQMHWCHRFCVRAEFVCSRAYCAIHCPLATQKEREIGLFNQTLCPCKKAIELKIILSVKSNSFCFIKYQQKFI